MTNELVRRQLDKTLSIKSLDDLVRAKTSPTVFLLIDCSGSMDCKMRNGKSRIDGLTEVVGDIQKQAKTKMIAFGGVNHDGFREGGEVREVSSVPAAGGGTPLHLAIDMAKQLKSGRVVVISDGVPDSERAALDSAQSFGGQIDVVYVGDPDDAGERFLKRLAASTGGTEFHGDLSEPKQLGKSIMGLLSSGSGDEEDGE